MTVKNDRNEKKQASEGQRDVSQESKGMRIREGRR